MNGSKLRVRHGSEGPRHDPYSYTEYTVERASGDVAVLHEGIGVWAKVNGRKVDGDEIELLAEFFRAAGVNGGVQQLQRIQRRIEEEPYRRHAARCGCREFKCQKGMPGETFYVCAKCGDIAGFEFDRSVIE